MIDWSKRAQPTLAADDIVGFDDYGKTFFACEVRREQDPPLDGQLDPNLFSKHYWSEKVIKRVATT